MIKKYSLKLLETTLNHALNLDPLAKVKLNPLEGKMLQLIIEPLKMSFFIGVKQQALVLYPSYEGTPDTIIHSTPLGLIRLSLLPTSKARSLFNEKIRLTGDVTVGENIKRLIDQLDIDWEEHLSHFTGDAIAYHLGSLFKQSLAFKKRVWGTMQEYIQDYVQEELRLFPCLEEVQDFFNDVSQLTQDVDRLNANLNYLLAKNE